MDIGVIFIASIVVLLLVGIYFLSNKKTDNIYKDKCNTDKDCAPNQKCIFSRDFNRKICVDGKDKKDCVLFPYDQLEVCNPSDQNSCSECINEPKFSCIPVNYGNPVITNPGSGYTTQTNVSTTGGSGTGMIVSIDSVDNLGAVTKLTITQPGKNYKQNDKITVYGGGGNCIITLQDNPNPYFWQQGKNILNIPESQQGKGWCLPDVSGSISCNRFTADSILIQNPDDPKSYRWGCYCKNPANIDHNTPGGDCTVVKLCGENEGDKGFGRLLVPLNKNCENDKDCDLTKNERCCWNSENSEGCGNVVSGEKGYCYGEWKNNQDTDPYDGVCDCNSGLTYYHWGDPSYYGKVCQTDSCLPGGIKQGSTCNCQSGYIKCPEDISRENHPQLFNSCQQNPLCLKDPCLPGKYNVNTKMCDCDYSPNAAPYLSTDSIIFYKCKDLCEDKGPCGISGDCWTWGEGIKKQAGCKNCQCPWFDSPDSKGPCINTGKQQSGTGCTSNSQCCSGNCQLKYSFSGPYKECE
jgi:hypothetical protein